MYLSSTDPAPKSFYQELKALPDGDLGTKRTLEYMREFKEQAKLMPEIRSLAHRIVNNVPAKDWYGELEAIQNWVKTNVRYTFDIAGVETLQRPDVTISLGHGDCDDQSTLVASLAETIGLPSRFVAVGGNEFEHVFAEVFLPGDGWVSVETTENVPIGWAPEFKRRMVVQ